MDEELRKRVVKATMEATISDEELIRRQWYIDEYPNLLTSRGINHDLLGHDVDGIYTATAVAIAVYRTMNNGNNHSFYWSDLCIQLYLIRNYKGSLEYGIRPGFEKDTYDDWYRSFKTGCDLTGTHCIHPVFIGTPEVDLHQEACAILDPIRDDLIFKPIRAY